MPPSLVELINSCRIRLDDVSGSDIRGKSLSYRTHVKSAVAEAMVHLWLRRCKAKNPAFAFDDVMPRSCNGLSLIRSNYGAMVFKENGILEREYDGLASYNGKPYLVEVKSNGFDFKNIRSNIKNAFDTGKKLYGRNDVGMLFFFPMYGPFRRRLAAELQHEFSNLRCIDTGYSRNQIEVKATDFYKQMRALRKAA